ncbi:universal stress protein [Sulfitobacter guttiformis]|uniref:Nucleotide-binding universal stress UspA family protein n=1 Tax=Sulfitobacter guttiformis TaxID=74349 RepID=A0A420DJ68_9RHOB|nr:universal stress protein [Sulfitobacter guttiformis]KIN71941.1 Universal stress protein family [Sulfitobacter guttiformis KCTC 32187]RKE94257.1 nucleotide-binding universal stress UspA family protein [Sulfitobacter guttiformis]
MTIYAKMRISNPAPYFDTPDQVLCDDKLSSFDKEKVLRSMALDADQMVEATAEGMAVGKLAYNAKDLQSALIQLEKVKALEAADASALKTARFQRVIVVTTVDQDLNREIADVAYGMAEDVGGKVYLLNVVPSDFDGTGLAAAGPMVTAIPNVTSDTTQIIDDRRLQLSALNLECGSSVETEIEVRCGQIEQVIVDYAAECNADVIIVGSPNRSWLEALLDPSVARKVTKSAPCPVLVVPEPA